MKYQPAGSSPGAEPIETAGVHARLQEPESAYKGEFLSTVSSRMVFNLVVGGGGYIADYAPWRSSFANPVAQGEPEQARSRNRPQYGGKRQDQL